MQRSPLHAQYAALGATFTPAAAWELPQHFGDLQAEYHALRRGVGLCDVSHRGLIRMTGKDRQRFLHAMVSNDTQRLQPGQGCYATFLNAKGHLVADFVVSAEPDAYLLELEPAIVESLITALDYFVISEDVVMQDESGQWGLLALQGPQAASACTQVLGQDVSTLEPYASLHGQIADHLVCCMQRSYTGDAGYVLCMPVDALPDVWQALWAQRDTCGLHAVGLAMLDVARIEAGIPVFGRDMSDATLPLEANLDAAISYTKGCYIGQEVIARIEARGHVNRKLVGLLLDGEALPEPGTPLATPQREVGWITSAVYSPSRQHNIALGYVRREVLAPGTVLEVRAPGQALHATVAAFPLHTVTT